MIIDVSVHNGTLNWEDLKGKIEGAILRCGYGSDMAKQDDKQWARNLSECERLGIPWGAYLYSYAKNEEMARSEAQHVLRLLKGHTPTLPIFYDLEEAKLQNVARKNFYAFAEAIGSAYRVGLYTGEYYYNTCMQGTAADYLWIARYGANDGAEPAKGPSLMDGKKIHLWQYTSKALGGHMDASKVLDAGIFGTTKTSTPTKPASKPAPTAILRKGSRGDAVKDLQKSLIYCGFSCGAAGADGIFGQGTYNAVVKFQRAAGLGVDGIYGPKSAAALQIEIAAHDVINGAYGNGDERKAKLRARGLDPDAVQKRVNKIMG